MSQGSGWLFWGELGELMKGGSTEKLWVYIAL